MNMLIDVSSCQPQGSMKINGGGEYAFSILKLLFNRRENNDISVILNSTRGTNATLNSFLKDHNIKSYFFSDLPDFSNIIIENCFEVIIFPVCYSFYCELKIPEEIKVITVIHDLSPIFFDKLKVKYGRYPQLDHLNSLRKVRDDLKTRKEKAKLIEDHKKLFHLSNNQIIVTGSYYSKSTFKYYLNLSDKEYENVKVVFTIGKENNNVQRNNDILQRYGLNIEQYYLLSSGCRWTKNNAFALKALDNIFCEASKYEDIKDFKVVITGVDEIYKEYYRHILVNMNRFIFLDYVNEEELNELYLDCYSFIFPSILEGFGLPPIEAMSFNKVPLCSTAMSIPEVCGDAAIYFDPYDEESLELAIIRSFDKNYMDQMKRKVVQQCSRINALQKEGKEQFCKLVFN